MELEAKAVSFGYDKKKPPVLDNVSFAMTDKESVAIVAPSGSGKSTFGRILAGVLKPSSGEILIDKRPPAANGVRPVQMIYQHPERAINPRWRLSRILDEIPVSGSSSFGEDAFRLMNELGIEHAFLDRFPAELSGGELQRFALLRGLLTPSPFLVLDEISTMLDVVTAATVWKTILNERARSGRGLIVITHNEALALRVCDRVFTLPVS